MKPQSLKHYSIDQHIIRHWTVNLTLTSFILIFSGFSSMQVESSAPLHASAAQISARFYRDAVAVLIDHFKVWIMECNLLRMCTFISTKKWRTLSGFNNKISMYAINLKKCLLQKRTQGVSHLLRTQIKGWFFFFVLFVHIAASFHKHASNWFPVFFTRQMPAEKIFV